MTRKETRRRPDKPAGEDGLGDMVIDPFAPRQQGFESLDVTLSEIKKVETDRGLLKLKLAQAGSRICRRFICLRSRPLKVRRRADLPITTPACLFAIPGWRTPSWGLKA